VTNVAMRQSLGAAPAASTLLDDEYQGFCTVWADPSQRAV
jgi:hypothetical protein